MHPPAWSKQHTPKSRPMLQRLKSARVTDVIMWLIGVILVVMIYGAVNTLIKGIILHPQWIDFIIYGLAQGGIYALIALGYTLVYGILRMINFAHSEVFMGGPFIGYSLWRFLPKRAAGGSPCDWPDPPVHRHGDIDPDRRHARTDRLPAAAPGSAPGAADHRHRRFVLSPIHVLGLFGSNVQGYPDQGPGEPSCPGTDPHPEISRCWSSSPRRS